jgi:oligogalacturonide lyase
MLRTPFASERIQRIDPKTGIKVIQITSYPTPSVALPYEWPSVTPDNERLVFMSQRRARRGAPWDMFRCDTDGLSLFQLTERDQDSHPPVFDKENAPTSILALDGRTTYVLWNGDPVVYSVDVETGRISEVASLEGVCPSGAHYQHMRLSGAGDRLFVVIRKPSVGVARVDLASGCVAGIDVGGLLYACIPTERRLVVWRNSGIPGSAMPDYVTMVRATGDRGFWSTDEDGGDERFIAPDMFSHGSVLGNTTRLQGCGSPPDKCIWIAEEGKPPERIVNGPYFWHSGPSWDGDWIVADTNWPDCGLQLVHVPTRTFRTLCHPGASLDHIRAGHPHPALSHDGRVAVFTSDRTGLPQVYVAHIIDEFRDSIIAGELDRPLDKWM